LKWNKEIPLINKCSVCRQVQVATIPNANLYNMFKKVVSNLNAVVATYEIGIQKETALDWDAQWAILDSTKVVVDYQAQVLAR
jgi:hypothetical protein